MALDRTIREAVRLIQEALDQFAVGQGWGKEDYAIYVYVNEMWGGISVTFIATSFDSDDDRTRWDLVDSYLRKYFGGGQVLGMNINLQVRDFEQVSRPGRYSLSRDFIEIHDYLGNFLRIIRFLNGQTRPKRNADIMEYTIIIGLEVHVQLLTESKMFSSCGTDFGLPPNTQTDPVSLGLPGTLPVMNRKAFELALKTAIALDAEIAPFTKWDRKNYYYPDLPKNYQISQYDLPFSRGGSIAVPARKDGGGPKIGLTRVHLEEDTGKLTHGAGGFSEVDLNRAGIPLLEIVTEPDLRSIADAKGCLEELRLTLRYLGVSDCEMQEGSLRCDANINLHIPHEGGAVATPIVEIKNLNSFRAVERALAYEVSRQFAEWQKTGKTINDAPKQTRGWNDPDGVTKPQREKETAADYRYFPEPDLVPVVVDDAWIARIKATIGELPTRRRERFEIEYGLSPYDANVLVEQGQEVADYFDFVAKATGEAKLASNWIQQDVLRVAKERKITLTEFPVGPDALADLINRVKRKEVNTNQGREVLAKMIEGGGIDEIIKDGGYGMVSDRSAIVEAVEAALAANPKAVEDLKNGKKKPDAVKGFLRGQVMKQTGGKADPALVGELLDTKLAELAG